GSVVKNSNWCCMQQSI
uniref:Uncharacterized protein n=1 Tax=Amphimedon queenslandica TaxID=400682 RepID=A0A1X7TMI3_AMPQE